MSKKEIVSLKKDLTPKFVVDSSMQKGNITYDALEPFPQNYDFILLTQKIKEILGKQSKKKKSSTNKNKAPANVEPEQNKPVDWTMQLAVINYLRRLLKHEKNVFDQTFYGLKIYENILDFFNSIRSILAQNALILFNELFSNFVPEFDEKNQKAPVINLIKQAIPSLLLKATTSQSFIKNEAKTCLETMTTNMKYNDTLITLLQGMNTQKIAEFELALALSNKMIKNLGKDFFMNNKHFGNIMGALGDVYVNNKSDLYKRRCKTILGTFEEVMTKEDFNKCLEKCNKKEKDKINDINAAKIQPNTKKEIHHFRPKSKDEKSIRERPKTSCNTKQPLKKNIDIKLVKSKNQHNENCDNVNNQPKAQNV
jgi:hypothetical protein